LGENHLGVFVEFFDPETSRKLRAREATRLWRLGNREKHRASVVAWRHANPEKFQEQRRLHRLRKREEGEPLRLAKAAERAARREANAVASRERERIAARARYQATKDFNRERRREQTAAWRAANPDYHRSWKAENREKVRRDKRDRKIARRAAIIDFLSKTGRGRCAYCRELVGDEPHIDHIVPRARGGSNARSNLQLTCPPCNMAKGARDPIEFAQSIGLLV
jgi:5-methylcytosine-specific restriction endonuclease McrA